MSSKLREAVNCLVMEIEHQKILENLGMFPRDTLRSILNGVKDALAEPVMNCEVGTEEEQMERYRKFCEKYVCCKCCPCYGENEISTARCFARWSQMTYESKVKNGTNS